MLRVNMWPPLRKQDTRELSLIIFHAIHVYITAIPTSKVIAEISSKKYIKSNKCDKIRILKTLH
jgi:hypothetical protein